MDGSGMARITRTVAISHASRSLDSNDGSLDTSTSRTSRDARTRISSYSPLSPAWFTQSVHSDESGALNVHDEPKLTNDELACGAVVLSPTHVREWLSGSSAQQPANAGLGSLGCCVPSLHVTLKSVSRDVDPLGVEGKIARDRRDGSAHCPSLT